MIGAPPLEGMPNTLSVHAARKDVLKGAYDCPAPDQGNECGECRACWDPEVKNVAYWLY